MPKLPVVKTRALYPSFKQAWVLNIIESEAMLNLTLDDRRVTIPVHFGKDVKQGLSRGILSDFILI